VHDIPVFSRTEGGGELGKSGPILEAAFSQDVLDGRLSPIVEIEKGRGVVLRATDHKLPQQKPLDAVRTEVVAAWKEQRGAELAAAAANDAVKRLTAGEAWDAVAKSLGVTPQAPKFVERSDQSVPMDIRRSAFESPKPDAKPLFQRVALSGGDSAVLELIAVREKPDADSGQLDAQLRRQLTQQSASSESQSYALAARAAAKVTLNPQALD
jgi:peptidyl-prolyl cis-trans isomerase D